MKISPLFFRHDCDLSNLHLVFYSILSWSFELREPEWFSRNCSFVPTFKLQSITKTQSHQAEVVLKVKSSLSIVNRKQNTYVGT